MDGHHRGGEQMPEHKDSEFCKLLHKTHIANLTAAGVIIAGVASVFMAIETSEMLILVVGAGIGYLFAKKSTT